MREQQDAYEFFTSLVDQLDEHLKVPALACVFGSVSMPTCSVMGAPCGSSRSRGIRSPVVEPRSRSMSVCCGIFAGPLRGRDGGTLAYERLSVWLVFPISENRQRADLQEHLPGRLLRPEDL